MPFYRFQIDANVPPHVVAERMRSIVAEKPTFEQSLTELWKRGGTPQSPIFGKLSPLFYGSVEDSCFHIQRHIAYRNSFLPKISGRIAATATGTRVRVTMFLHPFTAIFMTFWLGMVGGVGIIGARSASRIFPSAMFLFGVALVAGGFFPEAIKARRLISETIGLSMVDTTDSEAMGPPM